MDEEGSARPTVAGLLMATDDPRRWLPNAYVQAVAYRGNTIGAGSPGSAYQLDTHDVTGPLHHQGREPEYRLLDDAELLLTIHAAVP